MSAWARGARFTLGVVALTFIVIGAGFLFSPVAWAESVQVVLPTAMARTDFRATYGGFDLMFGVFVACCALRPAWHQAGLLASALSLLGFGGSRVLGYVIEGELAPLMATLVAVEFAAATLCIWLYRKAPNPGATRSNQVN